VAFWVRIATLVIRGDARSGRTVDGNALLPDLLQEERRGPISIGRGDGAPERSTVCLVDLPETVLVNGRDADGARDDIAIETEDWSRGDIRESATRL
jgi:hypothetical protein